MPPAEVPPTDEPVLESSSATDAPALETSEPEVLAAAIVTGSTVQPTANVNFRSGAGTSFRNIGIFRMIMIMTGTVTGDPIRSDGYDWFPISVPELGSGWVAGSYLREVTATPTRTPTRTATTTSTPTETASSTPTATGTATQSTTSTATVTTIEAPTTTPTATKGMIVGTATETQTPSISPTAIKTLTPTATFAPDDRDGDRIPDAFDNCADMSNTRQADIDGDGIGNVCDDDPYGADTESDGFPDVFDNCNQVANPDQRDADGDTIRDLNDNCVDIANTYQTDTDRDGVGDVCDDTPMGLDIDGDRVPDAIDNCSGRFNPDQYDTEHGSAGGDACDNQILNAPDTPIAVVRFVVVDQFGNNSWDFGVTGTVTRYPPGGPAEGPLGELSYGRGAAQLYLPIMSWCRSP